MVRTPGRGVAIPWNAIRVTTAVIVLIALAATFSRWWPVAVAWTDRVVAAFRPATPDERGHDDVAATDEHPGHDLGPSAAVQSIHLSPQARANLGLTAEALRPIALGPFEKSIAVPGAVVPRPGRTYLTVATPLTGVVTHVHATPGEAVRPGTLLFEIRLTHEDLVQTQTEFLTALGELDIENKEIARLQGVAGGAVAGKTLLERQYARDKLTALLAARREALRLHGLSARQVDDLATTRRLLQTLRVVAPSVDEHGPDEELRLSGEPTSPVVHLQPTPSPVPASAPGGADGAFDPAATSADGTLLIVEQLDVHKGQAVAAGERLARLADYGQLFLEGQAFDQDAAVLAEAVRRGWTVSAIPPGGAGVLAGLPIAFLGTSVGTESRTLPFYVPLPNEVLSRRTEGGQQFLTWRFRPGQRMHVEVPVKRLDGQIVLPVEAVVRDGAEWYVFQQNGDRFDRVPIHVADRNARQVVVAADGAIFPGDVVAHRSAHQLQMAVKNAAGGGADPHAGHDH